MVRVVMGLVVGWVLVAAWYLHNPLPEGVEQPWKYNALITAVRVISDMAFLGGWLGLCEGDDRICLRNIMGTLEQMSALHTEGVNVTDALFDGVEVRVYVPDRPSTSRGGLLYFHGGGFVAGTPKAYDSYSLWLSRRLDLVVVSVHYRLVPENPSPAPLTDAMTAARYLYTHAASWGVDITRLGVAGDSVGGNIAAALALMNRDQWRQRGSLDFADDVDFHLRFQVLSYPLLQGLTHNLPSYQQNDHHAVVLMKRWCAASVVSSYIRGRTDYRRYFPYQLNETHIPGEIKKRYGHYVDWRKLPKSLIKPDFKPFPYHEEYFHHLDIALGVIDPYNFPLMSDDLSDLPESYVMTGEFDPFRDDGILYAQRLQEAGVKVVHDYFNKGWHGLVSGIEGLFSFDVSERAMTNITNFISKQLQ